MKRYHTVFRRLVFDLIEKLLNMFYLQLIDILLHVTEMEIVKIDIIIVIFSR